LTRNPDGTFAKGSVPNPFGRNSPRKRAELKRQQIADGLIAGLTRPATEADRIVARTIAAAEIEAERLEAAGKGAVKQRSLVAQLLRQSAFRPQPAPAKPVTTSDPAKAAQDWIRSVTEAAS
jgi:hypothetical protein